MGIFMRCTNARSLPRSRCFLISLYNNIATYLGRGLRQAHFLAAFSRSHGCGNQRTIAVSISNDPQDMNCCLPFNYLSNALSTLRRTRPSFASELRSFFLPSA